MTKRAKDRDGLTHLQRRFVNFILRGNNQTDAYIKAGYKAKNKTIAGQLASRLIRKYDKVRQAIEKGQKTAADISVITQKRILEEYAKIAFFNPQSLYDDNGRLMKIKDMPADVAAVVSEIKRFKRRVTVKTYDKKGALDSLARIEGMFNDKLNLGFTAESLDAILSGLPEEFAKAVREELSKVVSYKRSS